MATLGERAPGRVKLCCNSIGPYILAELLCCRCDPGRRLTNPAEPCPAVIKMDFWNPFGRLSYKVAHVARLPFNYRLVFPLTMSSQKLPGPRVLFPGMCPTYSIVGS